VVCVFLAVPIGMFGEACGGAPSVDCVCRQGIVSPVTMFPHPMAGRMDALAESAAQREEGPSLESAAVDGARFVCADAGAQRAKAEGWQGSRSVLISRACHGSSGTIGLLTRHFFVGRDVA